MTKLIALIIGCLLFSSTYAQSIERNVLGSAGTTLNTDNYQLSFSVGEAMILPSPSATAYGPFIPIMWTIGFQQPHVAKTRAILHANNWVSAYPNQTNVLGQRVSIPPFVMVNGKVDLRFDNLSAGADLVAVTDHRTGNTVSTTIIKRNH